MRILREIAVQASSRLSHTSQSPFLDLLLFASRTLGKSKEQVLAAFNEYITPEQEEELLGYVERRYRGEPAAYIIGKQEFYGYRFSVSPGVLIPRPETEVLVEQALRFAGDAPVQILDLCCGSGCVGITLDLLLERASVVCSDVSEEAVAKCRENITALASQARCIHSDLFEQVPGSFQIITANPPYLTDQEMQDPQLLSRGEPEQALRGGEDGLDIIKKIIQNGFDKLSQKGYLMIETSVDQTSAVRKLMEERGFMQREIAVDATGRGRVVIGRRG